MFRKLINRWVARYILREYKRYLIEDIEDNFTDDGYDDWFLELRNETESSNDFFGVMNEEIKYDGDDEHCTELPLILKVLDKWLEGRKHALS